MFRTMFKLAGLVAAVLMGVSAGQALAAHDSWYGYAVSLTTTQPAPFITDTLAPGGTPSVGAHDPWYRYALSLTQAQPSVPLITDTLAPGGKAPVQSYRFTTDTLAPGGGPSVVSAPASHGFDWGDAGIGALFMAGIAVVLLASGRVLQRRRVVTV
jgi:hypothetical protein